MMTGIYAPPLSGGAIVGLSVLRQNDERGDPAVGARVVVGAVAGVVETAKGGRVRSRRIRSPAPHPGSLALLVT